MKKLSWQEYFMSVAILVSMRSDDPKTKVGTVIVNQQNKIIGTGYNGFPKGLNLPWDDETKHKYVVHSEANAILNSSASTDGATVYVTLFPCNECAKLIIQSGIKEVVYLSDSKKDKEETKASRSMLTAAGITLIQYEGRIPDIKF